MPYLSTSAVVIHYEEALYQMYGPLPFTIVVQQKIRCRDYVFNFTDLLSVVNSRTTLTHKNVKTKMQTEPKLK